MKKILTKLTIVVLVLVLALSFLSHKEITNVEAKSKLYGIQQIVDEMADGSELKMIELVPDYAYSSLGLFSSQSINSFTADMLASFDSYQKRRQEVKRMIDSLGGLVTQNSNYYVETLNNPNDDSYQIIDKYGNGIEAIEIRKGYYTSADRGDYTYTPKIATTLILSGYFRDGVRYDDVTEYIPEVGDFLVLTITVNSLRSGSTSDGSYENVAVYLENCDVMDYSQMPNVSNNGNQFVISSLGGNDLENASVQFDVQVQLSEEKFDESNRYSISAKVVVNDDGNDSSYKTNGLLITKHIEKVVTVSQNVYVVKADSSIVEGEDLKHYIINPEQGDRAFSVVKFESADKQILSRVTFGNDSETDVTLTLNSQTGLYEYVKEVELQFVDDLDYASLIVKLEGYLENQQCGVLISKKYEVTSISSTATNTKILSESGYRYTEAVNIKAVEDFMFTPGYGDSIWVDDENGDETSVYINKIYYKVDVKGKDVIGNSVLELDPSSSKENKLFQKIKVYTYTPSDFENALINNKIKLEDFDLLYLSNTSATEINYSNHASYTDRISLTQYVSKIESNGVEKTSESDIANHSLSDGDIITFSVNAVLNSGNVLPSIYSSLLQRQIVFEQNSINPSLYHSEFSYVYSSNTGDKVISDLMVKDSTKSLATTIVAVNSNLNSSSSSTFNSCDISWDTAFNIYEYVINTNLPVIVDGDIVIDNSKSALSECNVVRLAYLLQYCSISFENLFGKNHAESTVWTSELIDTLYNVNVSYGIYGLVNNSIYINYDGTSSTCSSIVNQNFATEFYNYKNTAGYGNAESYLNGMTHLIDEIKNDNQYKPSSSYTTEYTTGAISQASIVKEILNYRYRRVVLQKDSIVVLDIEPTKYTRLDEATVLRWIGTNNDVIKNVKIVQMSSAEFIGKLDDLIELYDMIYIGSCIGPQGANGALNQQNGNTVYNDSSMNGLIYSHVGDTIKVRNNHHDGLNDKDLQISDGMETRYSGNDITSDNYKALVSYVEAGYPVIIDSKLASETQPYTQYVDNSSFMYKFIQKALEKDNGTISSNSAINGLDTYINMPRLSMLMISQPTEYDYVENGNIIDATSINYLSSINGKYFVEYSFILSNTSESNNDRYTVELFVDVNADGHYSDAEELDGLDIVNVSTNQPVNYDDLKTGVRYRLTRELPSDYVGLIPWRLTISANTSIDSELSKTSSSYNASTIHTSAVGYSAVRSTNITTINALQIKMSNSNKVLDLSTSDKFVKLIKNLKDTMNLNVVIKSITTDELVNEFVKGKYGSSELFYSSYLANYDMLLFGFSDMYSDINNELVINSISMFIESGRSVLFGHDTTSFNNGYYGNGAGSWAYHLNQFLRNAAGMDRYGVTTSFINNKALELQHKTGPWNLSSDTNLVNAISNNNKDIAYKYNTNNETAVWQTHGMTNGDLSYWKASGQKDSVNYTNTSADNNRETTWISQVNKGQITTYPYNINIDELYALSNSETRYIDTSSGGYVARDLPQLQVAQTHYQYYQLDFNYDTDNDGNNNLVVWYTLSGNNNMYDASPNDVRNSYYIYSVGNVMYTGMGHSYELGREVTDSEAKLFINTIVAAYNMSQKAPSISLVSDSESKSSSLTNVYRTYDEEIGMIDVENESVFFYVNDLNVIHGNKTIYVKYYQEVEENEAYDGTSLKAGYYSTSDDYGKTVFIKELTSKEKAEIFAKAPGVVTNNVIHEIEVNGSWINKQLKESQTSKKDVRIWVGAYTLLNYFAESRPSDNTEISFDYVQFNARTLFDLE